MEASFGSPVVDNDLTMAGDLKNENDQRTPLRSPAKVASPVKSLSTTGRRQPRGAASARNWLASMSQSCDDFGRFVRMSSASPLDSEINATPRHHAVSVSQSLSGATLTPTTHPQPDQSRFGTWLERTTPYVDDEGTPDAAATHAAAEPETPAAHADMAPGGDVFEQWLRSTEPAMTPFSGYSDRSAATPFDGFMAPTSTVLRPKPLFDVGDEYFSEEEESEEDQAGQPTPYIAADVEATPPTATLSSVGSLDKLQARMAHMELAEQLEGTETMLGTPVRQKTGAFGSYSNAAAAPPEPCSTPYAGQTPANTPLASAPSIAMLPKTPLEKVLHMMAEPESREEEQQQADCQESSSPVARLAAAELQVGYDSSSDDEVTDPDIIELLQRSTGKVLAQRPARTPVDSVIGMMMHPTVQS